MNILIRIYDYFSTRHAQLWTLFGLICVVLLLSLTRLRFHEDIFDFLPQDEEYAESMQVYSSLSEAKRIVVIFEGQNADSICAAIDDLGQRCPRAITQVDLEGFTNRLSFIYRHLPYFLSEADYDSLDVRLQHIDSWLQRDRDILAMPGTSFLMTSIQSDPLQLIPYAKGANGQYAGAQSSFVAYGGYMMTSNHRLGFAFYDSPYGSTESGRNGLLVDSLGLLASQIEADYPSVSVRLLGAPVIAVGNARQIKHDTLWAILVSMLLIVALLLYAFPRKTDILLILLAVGFGWLCGLSTLALSGMEISVIVLGIGAVLLGIAVNYPLHILVHQRYTTSVRQTLQEVLSPLVVGNITTIGAFLALLPLSSPALRQLGIFAAALFVGTIIFCILFLPHLMSASPTPVREIHLPFASLLSRWFARPVVRRPFTLVSVLLFLLLAVYFGVRENTFFDSNLSHINYMTDQQRADFAYFESLSPVSDEPAYLASSARTELAHRRDLWNTYWREHDGDSIAAILRDAAVRNGFQSTAFDPFCRCITSPALEEDLSDRQMLSSLWPGRFDTAGMNARVATALSDNFDYLGTVCSLIVLFFLCLSFRSVWLGLIAFLPMVFSWVLIFALMQLFHLQFNIVNVILATFIFGQGDDYTIFVLEGLLYEYRTGRKMLPQYKQSIILSALFMLLAIGVLVFARHPAMSSLGAVTLIGMLCVVLMAYIVPPFLFRIYTHFYRSKT